MEFLIFEFNLKINWACELLQKVSRKRKNKMTDKCFNFIVNRNKRFIIFNYKDTCFLREIVSITFF